MTSSNDLSNVLSYLNDDTTNVKSSSDVTAIVNLIDRMVTNNQYTDESQTTLYSTASKLLSPSLTSQMREAQQINGSIVK
jgi:hypothetical protein